MRKKPPTTLLSLVETSKSEISLSLSLALTAPLRLMCLPNSYRQSTMATEFGMFMITSLPTTNAL